MYIDHIPYYLLGLPRALFSDNLINFSQTSGTCCSYFFFISGHFCVAFVFGFYAN